jgi:hypothetical protein
MLDPVIRNNAEAKRYELPVDGEVAVVTYRHICGARVFHCRPHRCVRVPLALSRGDGFFLPLRRAETFGPPVAF